MDCRQAEPVIYHRVLPIGSAAARHAPPTEAPRRGPAADTPARAGAALVGASGTVSFGGVACAATLGISFFLRLAAAAATAAATFLSAPSERASSTRLSTFSSLGSCARSSETRFISCGDKRPGGVEGRGGLTTEDERVGSGLLQVQKVRLGTQKAIGPVLVLGRRQKIGRFQGRIHLRAQRVSAQLAPRGVALARLHYPADPRLVELDEKQDLPQKEERERSELHLLGRFRGEDGLGLVHEDGSGQTVKEVRRAHLQGRAEEESV